MNVTDLETGETLTHPPTGCKGFHVPQRKTHAIFAVPLGSAYLGLIVLYPFYLSFNHGSQWHACFCKHFTKMIMVCVTCEEMHQKIETPT